MISSHVPADSTLSIGGTTYTVSVPRIKEVIELINHLKDREVNRAKKDCAGLPPAVQTDIMGKAREAARNIEFRTPEFFKAFESVEAQGYLFYLLIRRNHPSVTPEQAVELYGANFVEAYAKLVDILMRATGLDPTTAATE